MFNLFRRRKIKKYAKGAEAYFLFTHEIQWDSIMYCMLPDEEVRGMKNEEAETKIKSCDRDKSEYSTSHDDVQHSLKKKKPDDPHIDSDVIRILRNRMIVDNHEIIKTLEENVNQTFVDRLLHYISEQGMRGTEVYKAAHIDKRLFSKIISNREYKPSKDTVIALALALELSLAEANDLLSRAGYILSHSNKRDIIIEFFFLDKIYNLTDANGVLYELEEKLIGRF